MTSYAGGFSLTDYLFFGTVESVQESEGATTMLKTRDGAYEIPSVYIALAILRACERCPYVTPRRDVTTCPRCGAKVLPGRA